MPSHSDIKTNAFGEQEKKDSYEIGEIVVTYTNSTKLYQYGIVIGIQEKEWVESNLFRKIYTIYMQSPADKQDITVERFSVDIYLPHMKAILNSELEQMRSNRFMTVHSRI